MTGTAAQLERALYVNLYNALRPDGTQFHLPDRDVSIDTMVPIVSVAGINNYTFPTHFKGSGAGGQFIGRDLRNAYASCTANTGTGEAIGLFELNGFSQTDAQLYETTAKNIYVDASNHAVTPVFGVLVAGSSGAVIHDKDASDSEVALDVDMAMAMAPGATVFVFEAPRDASNTNAVLNAMAHTQPIHQMSSSWGTEVDGTSATLLNAMAAEGVSFFQASGDSGGKEGDPLDQRDLPSATLVGGTFLSMNGAGDSWAGETVWNTGGQASGGGVLSKAFLLNPRNPLTHAITLLFPSSIPSYQIGFATMANKGSTSFRNYPDVAAVADQLDIALGSVVGGGVHGTSAAAPVWAGFMALANQQSTANGIAPVGFANPVLYAIARTAGAAADVYAMSFNDVSGNDTALPGNAGFPAVGGYDLATGLGTPKCGLIGQLASPTPTVPGDVPAIAVAAGDLHTCAALGNGTVYCWGSNAFGQLGTNLVPPTTSATPLLVPGLSGVQALDAGGNDTCALLTSESISCWGADGTQQIGSFAHGCQSLTGDVRRSQPTPVDELTTAVSVSVAGGQKFELADIIGGGGHSCALLASGEMDCWGENTVGQLGSGQLSEPFVLSRVDTTDPSAFILAAGTDESCAVFGDSTVKCWGSNLEGQLGLGTSGQVIQRASDDSGREERRKHVAGRPRDRGRRRPRLRAGSEWGTSSAGARTTRDNSARRPVRRPVRTCPAARRRRVFWRPPSQPSATRPRSPPPAATRALSWPAR